MPRQGKMISRKRPLVTDREALVWMLDADWRGAEPGLAWDRSRDECSDWGARAVGQGDL